MAQHSRNELPDRSSYSTSDTVRDIWSNLGLPTEALNALNLEGTGAGVASSFKVGQLAQASIALSALTAALFHSLRCHSSIPKVTVELNHALAEFRSERLYTLNGKPGLSSDQDIGGLHKTCDGHVRVHDGFPHHRNGALSLVGLPPTATREEFAQALLSHRSLELESSAFAHGLVISALRSFDEWDCTPQAAAIPNFPITIHKINTSPPPLSSSHLPVANPPRCLDGIHILELSRVLAAPIAGRTLATHGASVLWITSPSLPSLPTLDLDTSRGKRTTYLDLSTSTDHSKLLALVKSADVFIQSYRPGSLASKGFSALELTQLNPNLIYATISAYGVAGPWSSNRGFDSLVQTCTGLNVAEAEAFNNSHAKANEDRENEEARVLPCQALDHASGYFLAAGINAALCKREVEGGSWEVKVSLAGTGRYLRSLGRVDVEEAVGLTEFPEKEVEDFMEEMDTPFGRMTAVKHAAKVEGLGPGLGLAPRLVGSDAAEWIE